MSDHAPDDPAAVVVPLALVDDLMEAVAGVIHDRPVQQLVAGQLLVETAAGLDDGAELLHRGLASLASAGRQARWVMWALTPPQVRSDHLAEDLELALRPANPGGDPVAVSVAADVADDPSGSVQLLSVAVHDVAVHLALAGQQVVRVSLAADAEGIEASVTADGPWTATAAAPWLDLARARLVDHAGTVEVDGAVTRLRVPTG